MAALIAVGILFAYVAFWFAAAIDAAGTGWPARVLEAITEAPIDAIADRLERRRRRQAIQPPSETPEP